VDDELPEYRVIPAPIQIDALVGAMQLTRHQIVIQELPAQAREFMDNTVGLRMGVADLEAMVAERPPDQKALKLSPSSSPAIAGATPGGRTVGCQASTGR
jgi:hypothetical protein